MNGRIAYEACSGGIRITRMNSVDKTIEVPSSVDGLPVTAIGPSFLSGSPGKGSRTLVIPSSVVDMDPEMLDGIASITEIDYDGDLSVFQRSKVVACSDCTLRCRDCGEEFDFDFFAGQPMSFPEFDDLILSLCLRLTPEIALKRLTHPVEVPLRKDHAEGRAMRRGRGYRRPDRTLRLGHAVRRRHEEAPQTLRRIRKDRRHQHADVGDREEVVPATAPPSPPHR